MTREESIDRLQKISEKTPIRTNGDDLVAITMAIQALSQEPSRGWEEMTVPCENCGHDMTFKIAVCGEQEPCDDAISRPTVVKFEGTNMACMGGDEIMKEFENNTQQNNDKAISLERAKKQIGRWIGYIDQDMINRICMSLDALPPVMHGAKDDFIYALKTCEYTVHNGQVMYAEEDLIKRFDELLSITPQKSGKWIVGRISPTKLRGENLIEYRCSECDREIRCTESQLVNYPYCHCGAKMVEPQERSDKE